MISINVSSKFKEDVMSIPGGENLNNCVQCGSCSGSCAISRFDNRFDPQRLMKMVLLGQEEILHNEIIWDCSRCYLCSDRCPENANPAEVIRILRQLAIKKQMKGIGVKHAKAIAQSIRQFGHLDEFRVILKSKGYSFNNAINYTPLAIRMLLKGKLPIPSIFSNKDELLNEIFEKYSGGNKK